MSIEDTKSAYMLRNWKKTLDQLSEETGITLREVCDYTGFAYNDNGVSFYVKLPRKRTAFIGIGMAFRQPVDVINNWIMKFGGKRRLYAKDISEDLVWIYLINANLRDTDSGINYFRRYEDYQSVAFAVFSERWDEIVRMQESTADVEISLGQVELGSEYDGIRDFVAQHMDDQVLTASGAIDVPERLPDEVFHGAVIFAPLHPNDGVRVHHLSPLIIHDPVWRPGLG